MTTANASSLLRSKRFYIAVFLFFQMMINYVDRVNLSIAAPVVAKHFHWDPATMGWVFSAYLWTYIICLVPNGMLVDRYGPRSVSAVAIALWSAMAVGTGTVTNFVTMLLARLGLGVGEASSFPVVNKVVRQWFPANERAFATSLYHSGMFMSMAVGTPLVAWAVLHLGWRWSFVVSGLPGFIWLALWLKWYYQPEECKWLSAEERALILSTRQDQTPAEASLNNAPKPSMWNLLKPLLRQKSMWGMFFTQGCQNYMNYLFLAWLPSYLVHRGMNLMKAGIYTAIPYLIGGIMEVVLGKFSDRILDPAAVKQGKRRTQNAVFLIFTSVVLLIRVLDNEFAIMAVITIALVFNTTVGALNSALTSDLIQDQKVTGTAFGLLLLGGNIFGLAAPITTGYIVKATNSFNSAFALAGGLALIGAILVFTMTRQPICGAAEPKAATAGDAH
jgi:ACS family glucarate transporter-like MFS transporter